MENEKWNGGEYPQSNQKEQSTPADYRYRWRYDEQVAYNTKRKKKTNRSGVLLYAFVTAAVFLLCFAMLAGMLIWYSPTTQESGDQAPTPSTDILTTAQVSEQITPTTVLVYASNASGYSYGTGFFLTSDGYIATNYHVVQNGSQFAVALYSDPSRQIEAELVGYRRNEDLAVLKIKGKGYPVPKIGDSDALQVGEPAIAVGNPSGEDGAWSTTQGVVSALRRQVSVTIGSSVVDLFMIQTDAALNPGNSGGPLCNNRGEIIGIVTRKLNDNEGISYALPINGCIKILNAIVKNGHAENVTVDFSRVRPLLGVSCVEVKKGDPYTYNDQVYYAATTGVVVINVNAGSYSDGYLKVHDIVVALNGTKVSTVAEITKLLYDCPIGSTIQMKVLRNGEEIVVSIPLTD